MIITSHIQHFSLVRCITGRKTNQYRTFNYIFCWFLQTDHLQKFLLQSFLFYTILKPVFLVDSFVLEWGKSSTHEWESMLSFHQWLHVNTSAFNSSRRFSGRVSWFLLSACDSLVSCTEEKTLHIYGPEIDHKRSICL